MLATRRGGTTCAASGEVAEAMRNGKRSMLSCRSPEVRQACSHKLPQQSRPAAPRAGTAWPGASPAATWWQAGIAAGLELAEIRSRGWQG
jgi:hypothetical protein